MAQNVDLKSNKPNTGKGLPKKRKIRFNKINDVKRFLARVLNQLDAGEITSSRAKALGYLVNILKDVIKESDLEVRISKIEMEILENEKS